MKKFYLCKLCVIVFGALLAVQQVIAFPNTGSFACEVTDTTAIEVVSGVPSVAYDPALIGSNLFVEYEISKVPESEQKDADDWLDYSINVEGRAVFFKIHTKFAHSDAGLYSVEQDAEIFRIANARKQAMLSLTRVYREDWEGFVSQHYTDAAFFSSLRCKRTIVAGE